MPNIVIKAEVEVGVEVKVEENLQNQIKALRIMFLVDLGIIPDLNHIKET